MVFGQTFSNLQIQSRKPSSQLIQKRESTCCELPPTWPSRALETLTKRKFSKEATILHEKDIV